MTDAARLKSTIYVGGLDNAVNQKILLEAFLPFGEIVTVTLPKPEAPSSTDPHRGFGYVEFEIADDALEAIDNMDQSELFGRVVKVAPAKPQKNTGEGLGSKTAIWEQEDWIAKYGVDNDEGPSTSQTETNEAVEAGDPMQGLEKLEFAGPNPAANTS